MKFVKLGLDIARTPPDPPACVGLGHKNANGLTEYGGRAIDEMMYRGMLIDVDHMSLAAFNATVTKAEAVNGGYPLVSGHTGFRDIQHTENSRTDQQLKKIADLGGMFGLGSSHVKAGEYLDYYLRANKIMGAGRVAFGTDLNGLEKGPPPAGKGCAKSLYNAAYVQSETGNKTWNYCTEGVAHYGMLPDFVRDLTAKPHGNELNAGLMQNAETFAQMWEKALKNGKRGNK